MILDRRIERSKVNASLTGSHSRNGVASDERGSALIEMALSVPIMLMLLTGLFSFGMTLCQKLQLAEALSSGGRVLAADRGDIDPCAVATSAIYAAAPSLKSSDVVLSYTIGGVSYGSNVKSCPGTGNSANSAMTAGA